MLIFAKKAEFPADSLLRREFLTHLQEIGDDGGRILGIN